MSVEDSPWPLDILLPTPRICVPLYTWNVCKQIVSNLHKVQVHPATASAQVQNSYNAMINRVVGVHKYPNMHTSLHVRNPCQCYLQFST